jgi:hypothetical protein
MVEAIYTAVARDDAEVMRVAMAGVRANRIVVEEEPFSDIDIEELYATLNLLADRNSSPLAPFVGAWSYNVQAIDRENNVGWDVSSVGRELARLLEAAGGNHGWTHGTHGFERALRDALKRNDGTGMVFHSAAETVLRRLLGLSHITEPEKVSYLTPLAEAGKAGPLWIASLNYDNAIELCAQQVGASVDVGVFKFPVEFEPSDSIKLIKLHGSVDWEFGRDSGVGPCGSPPSQRPVLVFGAGNKLQIEGPFLDLLFAFRSRLERTERLSVCGYSFRDAHVNHLIRNWLRSSATRTLAVSDPELTKANIAGRIMGRKIGNAMALAESAQLVVSQEKASDWVQTEFSGERVEVVETEAGA